NRNLAQGLVSLPRREAVLAPVQADGSLDQAIVANRRAARKRARVLARAISAERPLLANEIEAGVSAFGDHAIGKMVTICRGIRVARGSAKGPSLPSG